MTQRVLVDANIFVRRTLLDWLFHLRNSNQGMFQFHTTEDILAEAMSAYRNINPLEGGDLIRQRMKKISACMDEVITDFPRELPFTGKDDGDYHVHAAAIAARSDLILSADAPEHFTTAPDEEQYEVITPDEFFLLIIDSNPDCLDIVTRAQFTYWKDHDGGQLDDYPRKSGCPQFAELVSGALRRVALTL